MLTCKICKKIINYKKATSDLCSFVCRNTFNSTAKNVNIDALKELHNKGFTKKDLAKKFNTGISIITRLMKENNLIAKDMRFKSNDIRLKKIGADHPTWSGEKITYQGAHDRVRRHRKYTGTCQMCKSSEKKTEWASINKKHYDVNDYIELCRPCHRQYDGRTNKIKTECNYCKKEIFQHPNQYNKYKNHFCSQECSSKNRKSKIDIDELRNLYNKGLTHQQIADHFKIHKGTATQYLSKNKIINRAKK